MAERRRAVEAWKYNHMNPIYTVLCRIIDVYIERPLREARC